MYMLILAFSSFVVVLSILVLVDLAARFWFFARTIKKIEDHAEKVSINIILVKENRHDEFFEDEQQHETFLQLISDYDQAKKTFLSNFTKK